MAPVYDIRLLVPFRRELSQRGCPTFPDAKWHEALRVADLEAPCTVPRQLPTGRFLWDDESSRFCGFKEPRVQEGRRWWCAQIDRATASFWARRYGT
jgi:hypothetical protein